MKAEIIADAERLAAIEPAWTALFARVPAAPPFVAPAWLLPWCAVFRPAPLHTIAVWQDDRLVGLAPLYREESTHGRRLLPLGIGLSDLLDVLLDPSCAVESGAAIGAALAPALRDGTVWSAEDAPAGAAVLAIADPPGCDSRAEPQAACPALALPAGDFATALPARMRRKWQMARNRAQRRGATLERTTAATLDDDLATLFRLHGLRWTARGEAGVLADDAVARFHRAAAPGLLAAGLLRMLVLRIEGAPAGVYYGFGRGEAAMAYLGGFDPAFAFESPGTILIGAAMQQAQADGARLFSFLRGQESYKYAWGATDAWSRRRIFTARP